MNRRNFLNKAGIFSLPLVAGFPNLTSSNNSFASDDVYNVNFILEGHFFTPKQYIKKLSEIEKKIGINGDFYSTGGIVSELEEKFKKITGKESAIYMPSGTMANELSLRFLTGDKAKAIVHEESHIFRDEGDSAQAIHNVRLVPIKTETESFTLDELLVKINELQKGEAFYDGIGAIAIENPVRRHHGKIVDFNQIKKITTFANENKIKTHLDGARIHIASTYSGIPVNQYSSLFDTVYISLYKYLGAAGGAILCGSKDVTEPMRHYMKILGGTVFRSWTNAAVANHFIDGLEGRLQNMKQQSYELINELNSLPELKIERPEKSTNIVFLKSDSINLKKFVDVLSTDYGIIMNYPYNGKIQLHFNESILLNSNKNLVASFKDAIRKSK